MTSTERPVSLSKQWPGVITTLPPSSLTASRKVVTQMRKDWSGQKLSGSSKMTLPLCGYVRKHTLLQLNVQSNFFYSKSTSWHLHLNMFIGMHSFSWVLKVWIKLIMITLWLMKTNCEMKLTKHKFQSTDSTAKIHQRVQVRWHPFKTDWGHNLDWVDSEP